MRFGVDAIAYRASQLWQKVAIAIKDSSSLEIFKEKWSYEVVTIALVTCVKDLFPMQVICNLYDCIFENPRSVRFGVDAIAYRASQLWQKVAIAIKDSSSLEIFKEKWSYEVVTIALVTCIKDLFPMQVICNLYDCIFLKILVDVY